jgi:formylglycine-generating enzyme required for sulfatase activity
MPSSSTNGGRTATFLLRQPRQTQGFREVLRGSPSGDAFFERLISEAGDADQFFAQESALQAQPLALTLLWIPPGRFWMGSPPTEPERRDSESPQHLVQLQGFFMGQTPITQAQWREVASWDPQDGESWGRELKLNPSHFRIDEGLISVASLVSGQEVSTDQRPVEQVSWMDAMEFCNRLSQRTGRHYSLPSEAQWEYACRAGTTTPFHFGETISSELANYDGNQSFGEGPRGAYLERTTPVGMFLANAWGLRDMHGNVWEWCLDHWHANYEGAPKDGSAWFDLNTNKANIKKDERRVLRGGSWFSFPKRCRSAYRLRHRSGFAGNFYVGFRVTCFP